MKTDVLFINNLLIFPSHFEQKPWKQKAIISRQMAFTGQKIGTVFSNHRRWHNKYLINSYLMITYIFKVRLCFLFAQNIHSSWSKRGWKRLINFTPSPDIWSVHLESISLSALNARNYMMDWPARRCSHLPFFAGFTIDLCWVHTFDFSLNRSFWQYSQMCIRAK